jgi:hypothetical protein
MKWISLIPTPYKLLGLALVTAALIGIFITYRQSLINIGKDAERAICNAGKIEAINENIKIKDKAMGVIRANDADYFKWLQSQAD